MIIKILLTLLAGILSGILGRMGGVGKPYNTRYRDIGCSILSVLIFILWFGFKQEYWYLYLISIGLHWGAFSTYYDKLFGYDNFYFSGFMSGIALLPLCFIYEILPLFFIRAILLGIIWGLLHKFLFQNIYLLIWRSDVAEEFLRYMIVILTYLGKIIK